MIDLNRLNLAAVVRHYTLANTPRYLYRHLRSEQSLEYLAANATPTELLEAISACEEKTERTIEDVAAAYAMLVALSLQDYRQVQEALAQWPSRKVLAWTTHILSLVMQPKIATTVGSRSAPLGHIVTLGSVRDNIPTTIQVKS